MFSSYEVDFAYMCYCVHIWPPLEGYRTWFGKMSACVTPLYLKNWTLLDFHTWRVCTPPKWQEQALDNIFFYNTRSYQKVSARRGFFQSSRLFLYLTKHEFYTCTSLAVLTTPFQQSKLESLNMYTSKVIKLTKVSWNTASTCITKHEFHITNDSFFQQSKLEFLNLYSSKNIKLTKVSWNTPPIIIA